MTTTMTTTILDQALDAIPGHRAALEALPLLRQHLNAIGQRDPAAETNAVATGLLDAALTGDLPDIGVTGALQVQVEERTATDFAERRVTETAIHRAQQLITTTMTQGADQGLAVLRVELDDVLASTIQVVGQMGDTALNPRAAVAAGHADLWTELTVLAARYEALRDAQKMITSKAVNEVEHFTRRFNRAGIILGFELLDPDLIRGRAQRLPRRTRDEMPVAQQDKVIALAALNRPAPWPADSFGYLAWLATDPAAEPWVPTVAEFREREAEIQRRSVYDDLGIETPIDRSNHSWEAR